MARWLLIVVDCFPTYKKQRAPAIDDVGGFLSASSEHVVGIDGIAVVVNLAKPLAPMSTEQVAMIFSGAIDNWN